MASRCEQALSPQQCCFQGTLRGIELRGAGWAAFSEREGFSGAHIQAVHFRPSVHLISIDGPEMAQVEQPILLDALPLSGSQGHYRVIYSLPKPNTLGIELRLETEALSGLSFQGKTPSMPGVACEANSCALLWPMLLKEPGEKEPPPFYVDVEMSPEGTATLSSKFPWRSGGRVLSAKLEVGKGSLHCAGESAAKAMGEKSKPLRWQVDGEEANATRIEVSPLVMMKGELWAEVVVDGVKPEAAPMGWGLVMAGAGILAIAGLALGVWWWKKRRRLAIPKPFSSPKAPSKAKKIFYSYADDDIAFHQKLEKHLRVLERAGRIEAWDAHKIKPGDNVDRSIEQHLKEADIILLLISSDYVASDTLWNQQMKRALELKAERGTRVIPIYLKPCHVGDAPFEALDGLPQNKKPISQWENQDEAFAQVAEELDALISQA